MGYLKFILFMGATFILPIVSQGQIVSDKIDETKLYAESKQVNQFFRRFNGEEDEKGNRYYKGDKQFRSEKLRRRYLTTLFDASNSGMSDALKNEFLKVILSKPDLTILDFHTHNWYSEVQTTFVSGGKDQTVTLFMEIEKDHLGSKWIITNANANIYKPYFLRDTTKVGRFLHPMSHELDFMNMRKAFVNTDSVSQFAAKSFTPDHLSLLFYDIKKGSMAFKSVETVKFHFFQIDGWYFEISDFNRSGYNTGWLISNLVKLKDASEKQVLLKYLHHENR